MHKHENEVYWAEAVWCEVYPTCVSSKLCEFTIIRIWSVTLLCWWRLVWISTGYIPPCSRDMRLAIGLSADNEENSVWSWFRPLLMMVIWFPSVSMDWTGRATGIHKEILVEILGDEISMWERTLRAKCSWNSCPLIICSRESFGQKLASSVFSEMDHTNYRPMVMPDQVFAIIWFGLDFSCFLTLLALVLVW